MQRMKWADIAKAFAIIAVLIGHTTAIPSWLSKFVFTFHMPLFFVMSGYFMKDVSDIKKAVKKDAVGLFIPYITTCALLISLSAVSALLRGSSVLSAVKTWTLASLYGSGSPIESSLPGVRHIGALWFLLALFFAKLIIYLTQALGKYQLLAILSIAYIGYATTTIIWLPLSIQAGMTAAVFVYFGKLAKKHDLFVRSFRSRRISLYIFFACVWLFCILFCGKLYMVVNHYGNGLLDAIGGICAVFCLVWISMLIENHIPVLRELLSSIGSVTLAILCAHIFDTYVFPWQECINFFNINITWKSEIIIRFLLVAVICTVFYFAPFISRVYFPKKKKLSKKRVVSETEA